jgi:group II intron reverse transcriptase/maturase
MLNQIRHLWRRKSVTEELDLPGLFSMAALQRAWAVVRRNKGAAGVDGVTIRRFEQELTRNLRELQQELISGTYQPRPLKRILVPKRKGGLRPLGLWALRDRVAQRVVYEYLLPIFEPMFLDCSFGFRPGRSVADAVQKVVTARDANLRWVVDADIEKCFYNIDPRLLMKLVRRRLFHKQVLKLIESWLRVKIFNTADGRPAMAGVSQGNVLAPMLANIYLHEFDLFITKQGLYLVRYADDWVILCRRKREAEEALRSGEQALGRLRMTIHPEKTRLVHFDEGFKFLGHFFVSHQVFKV